MTASNAEFTSDVSGEHVEPGAPATAGSDASGDVRIAAPKADEPTPQAPKVRAPGRIMIMSPQRERSWSEASWEDLVDAEPAPEPRVEAPAKRRISAMAAVVALAAVTGAIGGSLATAGIGQLFGPGTAKTIGAAPDDRISRLDTEIAALKEEVDRNAKQSVAARTRTADRLDRLEKAQAEPAAKLAKLSETVEKLRATPAPAPVPVASVPARDVTGSINPPAAAPKPEMVGRLPLVEGWRLLDVAGGGATIEGRPGVFEVYAGDPVPGLGRIDAIRKQDGRWTVVTSKGLIVAR